MKRKASTSHDEAIVQRPFARTRIAARVPQKASLEDGDEARVLLIALRHLAQAQGLAKVAKAAGIERESLTGLCRYVATHDFPHWSPSLRPSD